VTRDDFVTFGKMPEFQYNNNNVVLAYHYGKSINYGLFRNLTIMEPAQKVLV